MRSLASVSRLEVGTHRLSVIAVGRRVGAFLYRCKTSGTFLFEWFDVSDILSNLYRVCTRIMIVTSPLGLAFKESWVPRLNRITQGYQPKGPQLVQ